MPQIKLIDEHEEGDSVAAKITTLDGQVRNMFGTIARKTEKYAIIQIDGSDDNRTITYERCHALINRSKFIRFGPR